MIYDSVFQKLLASIFSFDFTLCGKVFIANTKFYTHKAYRNSRKIFRCEFLTFVWTRKGGQVLSIF